MHDAPNARSGPDAWQSVWSFTGSGAALAGATSCARIAAASTGGQTPDAEWFQPKERYSSRMKWIGFWSFSRTQTS
jgi:hypothetical protein